MNILAITTQHDSMRPIIRLVQDGVTSPRSKRAYGKALDSFLVWYDLNGRTGLNKATIQSYRSVLESRGLAPASINQQLSAIGTWRSRGV